MNDKMFTALMKKYDAEIEDALYRIDALNEHNLIIPEHTDILGEVDKMLQKISMLPIYLQLLKFFVTFCQLHPRYLCVQV